MYHINIWQFSCCSDICQIWTWFSGWNRYSWKSRNCEMDKLTHTVQWTRVQVVDNLQCLQWSWWHHQMETFSSLLAICAGNSLVTGEFPTQRPVTQRFYVFFDLCLNKWLSKQAWGWWFEMLSRPLWRHCNGDESGSQMTTLSTVTIFHMIDGLVQDCSISNGDTAVLH